jgi:hypothetical protein
MPLSRKGSTMNEQQFDAALAQLTVNQLQIFGKKNGDMLILQLYTLDASPAGRRKTTSPMKAHFRRVYQ